MLKKLLDQSVELMRRDLNRIEHVSLTRKLSPGYARDLREYVKILTLVLKIEKEETKEKENDVSKLSDQELRNKAKELLGE